MTAAGVPDLAASSPGRLRLSLEPLACEELPGVPLLLPNHQHTDTNRSNLAVALQFAVERETGDRVGACHRVSHVGELKHLPFCLPAGGVGDELLFRLDLARGVAVAQLRRPQ